MQRNFHLIEKALMLQKSWNEPRNLIDLVYGCVILLLLMSFARIQDSKVVSNNFVEVMWNHLIICIP